MIAAAMMTDPSAPGRMTEDASVSATWCRAVYRSCQRFMPSLATGLSRRCSRALLALESSGQDGRSALSLAWHPGGRPGVMCPVYAYMQEQLLL